ncbi:MAG TPA: sigma-70 family RNA polymerase sigma factor [Anaerolineae bacterium]|nr:sigma-70 family RNA polymerase sigma factor [Anaerolineae bacterium]
MSQTAGGQSVSQRSTGLDPAIAQRLMAARAGDQHEFSGLTEPYRRELQLHCYRLLGSLQDAEDTVQETLVRAWRKLHTFEGRASLRAWLYKIATNACFDALDKRPHRRVLPMAAHAPSDPSVPVSPPITEPIWLEPYPDDLIADPETGPEARYAAHESVTLAFIAALQALPPRQRAVLIWCDVLDWRATEVAASLDMTVSAVNSALHRARATLAKHYHARGREAVQLSSSDAVRPLLERYVHAWESADLAGLVSLLKEDATFSMPPIPTWFQGRAAIDATLRPTLFGGEARGRWVLRSAHANRQPTYAVYQRTESGVYRIFGLQLLTFDGDQVSDVITFMDPTTFARFNLPPEIGL